MLTNHALFPSGASSEARPNQLNSPQVKNALRALNASFTEHGRTQRYVEFLLKDYASNNPAPSKPKNKPNILKMLSLAFGKVVCFIRAKRY